MCDTDDYYYDHGHDYSWKLSAETFFLSKENEFIWSWEETVLVVGIELEPDKHQKKPHL